MSRVRLATVWLDGCSGCHMSFLDLDERLITLAERVDLVYSPLVDVKQFPEAVDITLVEGAVGSAADYAKIRKVRAHTRILVSLGDCAVTANVPSMRNLFGVETVLRRAYQETVALQQRVPHEGIPALLPHSRPVHTVVTVDVFVPGCPPSADTIFFVLNELVEGRMPDLSTRSRFGA